MRMMVGVMAVSVLVTGCDKLPGAPDGVNSSSQAGSRTTTANTPVAGTLNSAPSNANQLPRNSYEIKSATTTVTQSGSAMATLALSKATVRENTWWDRADVPHYTYTPRFVVTEMSGRSGASFSTMEVAVPSGEHQELCFNAQINAGNTTDPFVGDNDCYMTDYGSPSVPTDTSTSSLTVILRFTDEQGSPGTLTARFTMN